MRLQRVSGASLILALLNPCLAAVRGEKAAYLGGTANIPKDVRGTFDFSDLYGSWRYQYQGGEFRLSYKRITGLEYGDKVGHRIGASLALGLTVLNPILALAVAFSHKEKHYLTVGYTQENGQPGVLVFELPKANAWTTVRTFENLTGKRAEDTKAERVIAAKDAPPPVSQNTSADAAPAPQAIQKSEAATTPKPSSVAPAPPPQTEERHSETRVVRLPE
jgi:hypothetical protein